jgi:hypothetical protein
MNDTSSADPYYGVNGFANSVPAYLVALIFLLGLLVIYYLAKRSKPVDTATTPQNTTQSTQYSPDFQGQSHTNQVAEVSRLSILPNYHDLSPPYKEMDSVIIT